MKWSLGSYLSNKSLTLIGLRNNGVTQAINSTSQIIGACNACLLMTAGFAGRLQKDPPQSISKEINWDDKLSDEELNEDIDMDRSSGKEEDEDLPWRIFE
jgi:hypothetical protein